MILPNKGHGQPFSLLSERIEVVRISRLTGKIDFNFGRTRETVDGLKNQMYPFEVNQISPVGEPETARRKPDSGPVRWRLKLGHCSVLDDSEAVFIQTQEATQQLPMGFRRDDQQPGEAEFLFDLAVAKGQSLPNFLFGLPYWMIYTTRT